MWADFAFPSPSPSALGAALIVTPVSLSVRPTHGRASGFCCGWLESVREPCLLGEFRQGVLTFYLDFCADRQRSQRLAVTSVQGSARWTQACQWSYERKNLSESRNFWFCQERVNPEMLVIGIGSERVRRLWAPWRRCWCSGLCEPVGFTTPGGFCSLSLNIYWLTD